MGKKFFGGSLFKSLIDKGKLQIEEKSLKSSFVFEKKQIFHRPKFHYFVKTHGKKIFWRVTYN